MPRRVVDTRLDNIVHELRAELDAVTPEVTRVFAEVALERIAALWPVKSGRSKQALKVTLSPVAIEVDIDYASFIHEKGERGPHWEVAIVQYIQEHLDELVEETNAR